MCFISFRWKLCIVTVILILSTLIEAKKNVLFILADDAGFETQVYNNTVCKTPNLNALAKQSLVFKHAYTSVSSCSPSRAAVLTGLPTHQNGMYGLHHSVHHFNSFDGVRSLPTILHKNGIRTGIIGKKHVGPESVYPFDFAYTEENHSIMQVGRNITYIKELVRLFLSSNDSRPFFLYLASFDPHRCPLGNHGEFCEKFGNGEPGQGHIPDWTPQYYKPEDVEVPYFIQDTPVARTELAQEYTSVGRLDQGIGLVLKELHNAGHTDDTLIFYTSDNGIAYQYAKYNTYEHGLGEPFLLSSPLHKHRWGQESDALINHLDIVPTILDWYGIDYPAYSLNGHKVQLSGKSLLPLLDTEPPSGWDTVYASHQSHEITMYYPMRVIRTKQYKLILNLNYKMPFPIDMDFAVSATFRDLINRTENHQPLHWFSTLDKYYYREPFEFFDIQNDPHELKNLYNDTHYAPVITELLGSLRSWQKSTNDPWICAPFAVLGYDGKCKKLDNSLPVPQFMKTEL